MPVLPNARHERMAQLIAAGHSDVDAHEQAGFKRNEGNAGKIARRPEVIARVTELNSKVAEKVSRKLEITAESLIEEVEEIKLLAMKAGQFTTALNAVKEKGILSGQRIERSEQGLPGEFAALADDEVYAEIRQQAAELGVLLEEGATAH